MIAKVSGEIEFRKADLSSGQVEALKLRYTLPAFGEEPPVSLYSEGEDVIRVPRASTGWRDVVQPTEIVDERVTNTALSECGLPKISLWADQVPIVQSVLDGLDKNPGGVIVAPCGSGKTVMSLEIARAIGCRTLVLVHKEFFVKQWRDRIREFFGEDFPVGVIQGDKVDIDKPIVIGMVQTLAQRTHDDVVYKAFGTVLSDEVHRLGAPTWKEIIRRLPAKYRIGVSATPDRKDGMESVFFAHLGPVLAEAKVEQMIPKVYPVPTQFWVDTKSEYVFSKELGKRVYLQRAGKINVSSIATLAAADADRNSKILNQLSKAIVAGRNILVLSLRLAHLQDLKRFTETRHPGVPCRMYVGGMNDEERDEAERSGQVLFATFQLAEEGLDIPRLDTLFLTCPRSDVTQAVGRILRKREGKKEPVVVDFVDENIPVCKALGSRRERAYYERGYTVVASKKPEQKEKGSSWHSI